MMSKLHSEDNLGTETFGKIRCPVLVMNGDSDVYNPIDAVIKYQKAIAGAQLSIIPGCDHVVLYCNFAVVWESFKPFLNR
jgi:pimeloyl-ACP methyl ester carboxylesterase